MSKVHIALIVDGHTEVNAIPTMLDKSTCRFEPLRRNMNGKNVSLERLAIDVASKLKALNCRGATLGIVIVDKEERDMSAAKVGTQLSALIREKYDGTFFVIVADIMFENWLLADIESIKRSYPDLIKDTAMNGNLDGKNGTSGFKKLWNSPSTFTKKAHGEMFFKCIKTSIAKTNSKSFSYFLDILDQNNIGYF